MPASFFCSIGLVHVLVTLFAAVLVASEDTIGLLEESRLARKAPVSLLQLQDVKDDARSHGGSGALNRNLPCEVDFYV